MYDSFQFKLKCSKYIKHITIYCTYRTGKNGFITNWALLFLWKTHKTWPRALLADTQTDKTAIEIMPVSTSLVRYMKCADMQIFSKQIYRLNI